MMRSNEFEKDTAITDLRFALIRLDQLIQIDGADLFSGKDLEWLEEEKNKLEVLWEVVRNAQR